MSLRILLALDLASTLVFAALGRRNHAEGLTLMGVLITAWPFLAGVLVGHLAARVTRRGFWTTGIVVWLTAVVVGMILRVLTGAGTQFSFIVVATVVLGAFMLGLRLLVVWALRQPAR